MTLLSRAFARLARLPTATTHDVVVDRGLEIPMPDGIVLLADHWYAKTPDGQRAPLLLSRTPYGRGPDGLMGRMFAERGYQTLVVSCRGTFGSGGEFTPFFDEQRDGHAVLDWIEKQPWFPGVAGTFGGSYVGLTQWSVAEDPPAWLRAMAPVVTSSNFQRLIYPGGTLGLESMLTWISGLAVQEDLPRWRQLLAAVGSGKKVAAAANTAPLSDADAVAAGGRSEAFQDWLAHEAADDPWWAPLNFGTNLDHIPPMTLIAGWFDIFSRDQLADFVALRAAGRDARLRVGPWSHSSLGSQRYAIRDTVDWMDVHLKGQALPKGERVQLFDIGAEQWKGFAEWPPPATSVRYFLQPGRRLSTDAPPASPADSYRYDPRDPTPGVGGRSLNMRNTRPKDNRPVEARPDVLTYTTEPLDRDITVIGTVRAELRVRSSLEHADYFVRLCDVAPKGASTNLCDGIVRLRPGDVDKRADGCFTVEIELAPTASTFKRGHAIRLQVSSGAHPIYSRNLGSGEPVGKATTFVVADHEVFHDPDRPSALVLPVL